MKDEGGEVLDAAGHSSVGDRNLEHKHAAMLERLSNKHQSRLAASTKSDSRPDSIESLLSRFSQAKLSIESDLSRIHDTPDPHSNPTLKSELEKVSISISELEKLVAENSYILPSYEVRTWLKATADLRQTLEQVTSDVVPKKKFSFKNKSAAAASAKKVTAIKQSVVDPRNNITAPTAEIPGGFRLLDSPGFRNTENEILSKRFEKGLGSSEVAGEFMLSELKDCEIRLLGCLRALFVHRLRNCKVYVGAVFGSVLIEEAEGCIFVLASHQIRIHHAKECHFYLRVRSRPIIEDSNGLKFAPYCLKYDGIEKDLEEANLWDETGNWANVDDFRWLRAVQSPNWSVLPESERLGEILIANI